MKKILLAIFSLISVISYSQTTGYLRYDTVRMQRIGGNSTLVIENATRNNTNSFLQNYSQGRTRFAYALDSVWIDGDSIRFRYGTTTLAVLSPPSYTDADARSAISLTTTGTSGAATYTSATGVFNIPNYQGGGISEVVAGYGLTNVNDSTLDVDSLVIANRDWVMDRIEDAEANLIVQPLGVTGIEMLVPRNDTLYHRKSVGEDFILVDTLATGEAYVRLDTANTDLHDYIANYGGGAATIGGSIAANQIAVGNGVNTIAGSNNFTNNGTLLEHIATAQASTAETIFKFSVSDDATNYINIANTTSAASRFGPIITGHVEGLNTLIPMYFVGEKASAIDNSGTSPAFRFTAQRVGGTALTSTPLVKWFNGSTEVMELWHTGTLGIGITQATDYLQIKAGTATIGPIRLTAGTNLTTPRTGSIEYNGTEFFMTATASNRRQVVRSNVATPTNGQLPISNGIDFTLATITEGQNINVTNGAGSITVAGPTLTKNATIENPTSADNLGMFRTPVAITITNTHAVLVGSGSPSVTYNIAFGTDITSLTNVYTAGQTVTSTTTGTAASGVNDATIPANSWVRITTSAATDVTQISLSITYTED